MGAASGHHFECRRALCLDQPYGYYGGDVYLDNGPCALSHALSGQTACSICTGDVPARPTCEEEEVLVEPCSILEELGFMDTGFAKCAGQEASPPPSPRACRRTFSSPSGSFASAPHVGSFALCPPSPSFALCPPPLPTAESPSRPDGVPDGVPLEMRVSAAPFKPLPVAPWNVHPNARTPPGLAVVRKLPGPRAPLAVALASAAAVDDDVASEIDVTPEAAEKDAVLSTLAPEAMDEPKKSRPWSPGAHRSPYRGGVLSLFTPSPPSPPRRAEFAVESVEEADVKHMDEDAQIALALEKSLQEVAQKPELVPKKSKISPRSGSTVPRALLAVARPFRCNRQRPCISMSI